MSLNLSPFTWRLRTSGGIPYKLMEDYPTGSFEEEDATVEEQIIIRATDLRNFLLESYPPMLHWPGGFWAWQAKRPCPHLSSLFTKSISFEPIPKGKPVDPWSQDVGASAGTYVDFLLLKITYGTGKNDPDDPKTFLEISATAGAEFLNLPAKGHWDSVTDPVKDINIPLTKLVPETEWSVRFTQVPREVLGWLLEECRPAMGKVNDAAMPLLFDAPAETMLFVGWSMKEQFSWRADEEPPAELELKFVEKRIEDAGVTKGHNHFFRPSTGKWEVLHKVDGNKVYDSTNLNLLLD